MSNVIALNVPSQRQSQQSRENALLGAMAQHRRGGDDVFWLKENAELLNILECTGAQVSSEALAVHAGFYETLERRLGFFPQYYRFILSICLDLEDLGMPGTKGESLTHWAASQGLADAELSDLQRAEARRLMQRRGVTPQAEDTGLTDRLHAFMDRSDTFSMPNKKAAYELTHIVFYLSEYGRRDPDLSEAAVASLEFAGILAYLDQNTDLLAEICVALRYAGHTPSQVWENWLARELERFHVAHGPAADPQDDYHDYFVNNWLRAVGGKTPFVYVPAERALSFHKGEAWTGPLRQMSQTMFDMADDRCDDWHHMRPTIEDALSETGYEILTEVLESTDRFEAFFAGFARTGLTGVRL